jgi:hypothetical protein
MTWANVMQHPLPFIMGACGITLVLSIARLVVRPSRPHTGRHVAGHELPANSQPGWDLELHDFPAADEDQAAAGLPTLAQQAVWLPSYFTPPVRHNWREQTAADLAPEALDAELQANPQFGWELELPTTAEVEAGIERLERLADTGDWMSVEARWELEAALAVQDADAVAFCAWMRAEFAAVAA